MILKLELEEDIENEFQKLEKQLEKERAKKELAQQKADDADKTIKIMIKTLFSRGKSKEEIAVITGKSIDEIKRIISITQ